MLNVLLLSLLAALPKAVAWLALVRWLRPHFSGRLETALAAWLGLQGLTITLLLVLSLAGQFDSNSLRVTSALGAGGLALLAWRYAPPLPSDLLAGWRQFPVWILLGTLALPTAALAVRAVLFYDATDDSLFYGMTRIAFWVQHGSLFAHQESEAAYALFYFPWTGELNALYYFLFTGLDRTCVMGNVETWLFFTLTLVFALRTLGAAVGPACCVAFFLASMPNLVSLAATIKGDLPSILGAVLGLVWTFRLLRDRPSLSMQIGALAACAFAAGGKNTIIPSALALWIFHFYLLLKEYPRNLAFRGAGFAVLLSVVFCSRYLLNLGVYGEFTDHSSVSYLDPGFHTLAGNLRGLFTDYMVDGLNFIDEFALFTGPGLTGYFALAFVFALPVSRWKEFARPWPSRPTATGVVLMIFLGALLVVLFTLPWTAWSLRYYQPWLLVLLMLPLGLRLTSADLQVPGWGRNAFCAGMWLVGMLHFHTAHRPSDLVPGYSLKETFEYAQQSDLDRKAVNHPEIGATIRSLFHHPDGSLRARRVALLCGDYAMILPLFGDNARNPVDFVTTLPELVQSLRSGSHEVGVIARHRIQASVTPAELRALGCKVVAEAGGLIFLTRLSDPN